MDIFDKVQEALSKVRPFIKADGGDIELVKIENSKVFVKFKGACIGCPLSLITLKLVVEEAIQESVPIIKEVISVD